MIVRSLPLRHGRRALAKSSSPARSWHRCMASDATKYIGKLALADSRTEADIEAGRLLTESRTLQRGSDIASMLPPRSSLKPEDIRDPEHPVAKAYLLLQYQRWQTDHLGAPSRRDRSTPGAQLAAPLRPHQVTLEALLAAQAHLGHSPSLWHPGNAQYIHGVRGGEAEGPVHVISLDATATYLRRAAAVVRGVTARGGLVLFVGTRAGQARCVERAAQLARGCHLFTRWTPGSITNAQQILGRGRKRVVDEADREVLGFQDQLRSQAALKPDLVVCLNPLENYVLLQECGQHHVPTIGIVDTDVNPSWVTYPIPANDDSLRCVQLIAGVLGRAGEEGQQQRLEAAERGHVVPSAHDLSPPTAGQAEKELAAAEMELALRQKAYEEARALKPEELKSLADAQPKSEESEDFVDDVEEDLGEGLQMVDPSLLSDQPEHQGLPETGKQET